VRALARALTRVENRAPDSFDILRQLFPHTGQAQVIGITGSPGVGKSSIVDRMAAAYRKRGNSPAVVAVDPSSPFTGGAILGDRIRMTSMSPDSGVFIRSMATRGNLGGLAAATADVVSVLDAASRSPILVETVGVGQDEIDIVKLADICIVVLVPGLGDDVQALKAGLMEIADLFVINKSDRPGAEKLERAIVAMLSFAHRPDGWIPPVVKTVATEGEGIEELLAAIEQCQKQFEASGIGVQKKRDAVRQRLMTLLQERLVRTVIERHFPGDGLHRVLDRIINHEIDPYTVVENIVGKSLAQ